MSSTFVLAYAAIALAMVAARLYLASTIARESGGDVNEREETIDED